MRIRAPRVGGGRRAWSGDMSSRATMSALATASLGGERGPMLVGTVPWRGVWVLRDEWRVDKEAVLVGTA